MISCLKQIAVLAPQNIPTKVYRLRWRFYFADGRSIKGPWDGMGTFEAWKVKKEGLIGMVVEGECRDTFEIETLWEVPGQEYAVCQWLAYARIRGMWRKQDTGPIKQLSQLGGLQVYTNNYRTTIFVNGKIMHEPLNPDEKLFKFKEHSV